jgi:hypothetical protein
VFEHFLSNNPFVRATATSKQASSASSSLAVIVVKDVDRHANSDGHDEYEHAYPDDQATHELTSDSPEST